jgi:hypothetical protein
MKETIPMNRHDVSLPRRQIVFSPEDERRFSELVLERFPDARFFDELTNRERRQEEAPEIPLHRSIADCGNHAVGLVFEPGWSPVVAQWSVDGSRPQYAIARRPYPNGTIQRCDGAFRHLQWKMPPISDDRYADVERITAGELHFRCEKGDKAQMALARAVLRLIAKMASNRYRVLTWPAHELRSEVAKGGEVWIGDGAAAWVREKPGRILDFWPPVESPRPGEDAGVEVYPREGVYKLPLD